MGKKGLGSGLDALFGGGADLKEDAGLLNLPISAIVQHLTGISYLRSSLPPVAGVVLVIISMVLTLIAGLIPARLAAKRDPVEALRSE